MTTHHPPLHATPQLNGTPYSVERHVFAGVPCLIERPLSEPHGLVLVYHGVNASKEGNLGIFTPLVHSGVAVVLVEGAGHGERRDVNLNAETLGYRNFVRTCAARTSLEAHALIDELQVMFPNAFISAVGISMGGYVAQYLTLRDKRVQRVVVISSGGVWSEPEVTLPFAREFLEAQRPSFHAYLAPPTRLLLLHGEDDEVFPLPDFEATVRAYRSAYEHAGLRDHFRSHLLPNVGHYTTPHMRDLACAWLTDQPDTTTS